MDAAGRHPRFDRLHGEEPVALRKSATNPGEFDEQNLTQHPLDQVADTLYDQAIVQASVGMIAVIIEIIWVFVSAYLQGLFLSLTGPL